MSETNPTENKLQIDNETKTLLKKNYFFVNKAKFPSYTGGNILLVYLFLGISVFVLIYFKPVTMTYIFATILVIMSFIFSYRWLSPYYESKLKFARRPTHDQMENWLVRDIRDFIKPSAIDILSLNPATISPENFIIVPQPIFWEIGGVPKEHIVRNKAGEYFIYATYKMHVVALSQNYISYYTCVYDWLNNKIVSPFTLEFFFEDISSITAENQDLGLIVMGKKAEDENSKIGVNQTVVIRNKSGESMSIVVNIPSLLASPRTSLKTEKVMQTLRIMLRHRRFGEEFEIKKPENT